MKTEIVRKSDEEKVKAREKRITLSLVQLNSRRRWKFGDRFIGYFPNP